MAASQLFGSPASPFVRKVRIALALKNLHFEFTVDAPSQPGSRVPQINPLGKIPVLIATDGDAIYDSSVILDYLEAIAPEPALMPTAPLERVRVKRWEALGDGILDAAVAIVTERRRDPKEQSLAWIDKQRGKIERALVTASEQLGQRQWCFGSTPTLADIVLGVALDYLDFRLPEIVWHGQHPNLGKLRDTLSAWPAFRETVPPPA